MEKVHSIMDIQNTFPNIRNCFFGYPE